MINVLIIDQMHDSIVPMLKGIGINPDYRPDITAEEVHELLPNYEGLILRSKMKVKVDLLEKAPRLKFVARAGAGVDEIDNDYLDKRNITLLNAPEGNCDAVGEHALGILLCLMNNLHTGDREVRAKKWRREANRGYELHTRTVGIIGYGNMGQAFAKRLKGFGCEVLAYDNVKTGYSDEFAKEASLEELHGQADVLSFHIPLNDYNKYLVDEEYLGKFKKPLYLINLARGEIMKLKTIKWALETGKVTAAGLDVLENEKLQTLTTEQEVIFDWLAEQDNVLFSPHVGGWTFESYERINKVLTEKIDKLLNKA
ncbi:NAD(P)-dependent oxidoreductase [Limibacter armeniacum]|uniref:NAD(P)-dependent oxidoreductase n=1 Tax=Limibacter armeniacum TaxID=466084 RepID=UPI002FE581B1